MVKVHNIRIPVPKETDTAKGYSVDVLADPAGKADIIRVYMHLKDGRGHYRDYRIRLEPIESKNR